MIVFDLICRERHRFEGWFSSSEDFTSQQSRGLLNCPVCGGVHVEKLPAAKVRTQSAERAVPAPRVETRPDSSGQMDISRIVDYVLMHSEDVGRSFAEEARKIYRKEAPQRSIRGTATPGEADDLHEEGVPVFTLPIPPQDRWN
jgi:hypothetical protein